MHGHGISNSGSDLKYEILKIRENGSNTQQSESFRLLLAKCIRRRKYTIPFLLNRGGVLLRLLFENLRTSIPWWPKIRTWNQDAYTSIEHWKKSAWSKLIDKSCCSSTFPSHGNVVFLWLVCVNLTKDEREELLQSQAKNKCLHERGRERKGK